MSVNLKDKLQEMLFDWHSDLNAVNSVLEISSSTDAPIQRTISNCYADKINELEELLDSVNDDDITEIIAKSEHPSIEDLDNQVSDYFENVQGLSEYDKPRFFHNLFTWAGSRGYSMDQLNESVTRKEQKDSECDSLRGSMLSKRVDMFVNLCDEVKPKRAVEFFNDLNEWARGHGYSAKEIYDAIDKVEI